MRVVGAKGTAMFRSLSVHMTGQRKAAMAIRRSQERDETRVNSIEGMIVREAEAHAQTFLLTSAVGCAESTPGGRPERGPDW